MIISFNRYNGGGSGSGSTDLTNYWNSAVTEQHIESAASITYASAASYADLAVAGIDMSGFYTSAQTEDAIAQAVSGLASEEYVQEALSGVDLSNYYTSAQTEEAITSKNYITSAQAETQIEGKNYITSQALTAYTPTTGFSTINGSAITNGGNIEIQGGGGSTDDIELPIAAAVNELKTNIEARLDQQYYKKAEVNDIAARKLEAGQVDAKIKDYVDPAIAEINASIEDKELATSAALNELNSTTVKSTSVKNIWSGSQSDYDDILEKDPETLYIINNQ